MWHSPTAEPSRVTTLTHRSSRAVELRTTSRTATAGCGLSSTMVSRAKWTETWCWNGLGVGEGEGEGVGEWPISELVFPPSVDTEVGTLGRIGTPKG